MNIVIAIIFISVIGTLLHFMYEWSGHNKVISLLPQLMKVLGNISK